MLPALLALGLCGCAGQAPLDAHDPRLQQAGPRMMLDGRPLDGVVMESDAAGHVLARHQYADGLLEGAQHEWYASGDPSSERWYHHGEKVGHHRGWWPGGQARFDYHFVDGEYQGVTRTWFASGRMSSEQRYDHGHESGWQRSWYDDGRVHANYYYRDGRRYGTIGAKLCINETHS